MKKIIALLLALVMVIGMVACGAKDVEPTVEPTEAPTAAPTEEIVEATEEVVETPTEEVVTEPVEVDHYVVAPAEDFTWEELEGGYIGIRAYNGNDEYVVIPDAINDIPVGAIQSGAFANTTVVGVKLPDSAYIICDDAFRDVTTLVEVEFGAGLGLIGGNAFNGCTALTTVVMNDGLAMILEGAFANCPALHHVDLPANIMTLDPTAFDAHTITHTGHGDEAVAEEAVEEVVE